MSGMWNGFEMKEFSFEGFDAKVVLPKQGTANGRLAIKTEYWNAFPATEIALVERGFHLCFIKNETRFALDSDVDRKKRFLCFVASAYGLQRRAVLIGMSCGGLAAILFAARHPDMVSCMYLDAPVLNYLSWPCGFGSATVGVADHQVEEVLRAHGMQSISQLLSYRKMPLDKLPALVASGIPAVLVAGGSDPTVPFHENGAYLQAAYGEAGIDLEVHIKPNCAHHPHGLEDCSAVVDFLVTH